MAKGSRKIEMRRWRWMMNRPKKRRLRRDDIGFPSRHLRLDTDREFGGGLPDTRPRASGNTRHVGRAAQGRGSSSSRLREKAEDLLCVPLCLLGMR